MHGDELAEKICHYPMLRQFVIKFLNAGNKSSLPTTFIEKVGDISELKVYWRHHKITGRPRQIADAMSKLKHFESKREVNQAMHIHTTLSGQASDFPLLLTTS